jgi:hypothetical protein
LNDGSRSDDDTIIGKLTLELSQMKVSYQQFVRKYENIRANLRKAQLEVQKLEQQLDSKDATLQETRMKSRIRILAAEKALVQVRNVSFILSLFILLTTLLQYRLLSVQSFQLKDELHPSSRNGASGSLLAQLEALNNKIRELTVRGEENAASLLDAERSRIKLEGVLQEKEEEYARTQEQLDDFRTYVQGGGRGRSGGGENRRGGEWITK